MPHHDTPLKFLMPGWFAIVMGLCGLSLAWHRATPLMGEMAGAGALVLGVLAAVVALVLAGASLLRWQRHPKALAEDLNHPVRHVFVAAMPISLLLLATVATALAGPSLPARVLWLAGSIWQFTVTVWVLSRWLRPNIGAKDGTPFWPFQLLTTQPKLGTGGVKSRLHCLRNRPCHTATAGKLVGFRVPGSGFRD